MIFVKKRYTLYNISVSVVRKIYNRMRSTVVGSNFAWGTDYVHAILYSVALSRLKF